MDIDYNQWLISKILEYVGEYRKSGTEYNFRCPICGDSTKNKLKKRGYLGTNRDGNVVYFCQNCNAAKSGISLLKMLSGEDFNNLKEDYFHYKYGKSSQLNSCTSTNACSCKFNSKNVLFNQKNIIKPEWKHELSDEARNYLKNRMVLDAPFLKEKFYSFESKSGGEFILIPWVFNGVSSYFQLNDFLKIDKMHRKYIFPKGFEKMIYGLDNIDLSWPYIIVEEGVYDSLFVPNCIAVGGKNLTDAQYELVHKRYPHHQIVIGFDNDKPGLTSIQSIIEKDTRGLKYFKWFDENTKQKDINDFVMFKNDVNIFNNKKKMEEFIVDSLKMKLYLLKNGFWKR